MNLIDTIQELPLAERLKLVEQIWDSIHGTEETALIRDWHQAEARQRAAELEADPGIAITRDELWNRVDRDDG